MNGIDGRARARSSCEPLHVHRYGPADGLPLLALHGITGHAQRWEVLAGLLPGVRTIAVDLRGHGHSPWTPPWSIEQHVADAVAVLDAHGLDRVAVAGHSYGGAIALHMARLAAERVERLVLLDPAVGLDPQEMLQRAEESRPDESFASVAEARADRAERWGDAIPGELVDAELTAHLVPHGDRFRYRVCRAGVVAAWSEMARPAITPPAGLPTLLLPATRADYVQPAWVQACHDALGHAFTVAPVESDHVLILERPAEVARHVNAFLAG